MTYSPAPVWLDCDPGNDDAFAILLLCFSPHFNLLGISTVYGNAPLDLTTRNALGLLHEMKVKDIPVYSGATVPLEKAPRYALNVHGASGLGGVEFPASLDENLTTDKTYLEAMRDAINSYPGEISLVVTGAYTNVSILFEKYPDLKAKVKLISVMGGSFGFGNASAHAEFNIFCDPLAAKNLIEDPALKSKIIINALNATYTTVATKARRDRIYDGIARKAPIRKMFYDILSSYTEYYKSLDFHDGPPLHDPLAVFTLLALLHPHDDTFGLEYFKRDITIVLSGENEGETAFTNGAKFNDGGPEEADGSFIVTSVNVDKFYKDLTKALDRAEENVETN